MVQTPISVRHAGKQGITPASPLALPLFSFYRPFRALLLLPLRYWLVRSPRSSYRMIEHLFAPYTPTPVPTISSRSRPYIICLFISGRPGLPFCIVNEEKVYPRGYLLLFVFVRSLIFCFLYLLLLDLIFLLCRYSRFL